MILSLPQRCFAASGQAFELRRCLDGTHVVHALETCGNEIPRAVILDLKMPLMDGFEALAWIRQQPAYQALPVIILSSSGLAEDRHRAAQLGATEYLVKPHSLPELEKLLKDLATRLAANSQFFPPSETRLPPRA